LQLRLLTIDVFIIIFAHRLWSLYIEYERFAAPGPSCSGGRPVCTTCLYASNSQRCLIEGYEDDCSSM